MNVEMKTSLHQGGLKYRHKINDSLRDYRSAMCFFLGVCKYTPVAALQGEIGWEPSIAMPWPCIDQFLVRTSCTSNSRLNKRVFCGLNLKHLYGAEIAFTLLIDGFVIYSYSLI